MADESKSGNPFGRLPPTLVYDIDDTDEFHF